MCNFPSWIEAQGRIWFLTDKDLHCPVFAGKQDIDLVGHDAIVQMYGALGGIEGEGVPCPPEVTAAIKAGKMARLMRAGGYHQIALNDDGQLHRDDGPAVECANGAREWWVDGKRQRFE